MEESRKEVGMREDDHKQWSEASNLETREERSIFNPPQPPPSFHPALSSHLPTVGLQNSSALPQMPMYPSRFYYQYYTPPPYSRPMFDPCASYSSFYQNEGSNSSLISKLIVMPQRYLIKLFRFVHVSIVLYAQDRTGYLKHISFRK